MNKNVIEEQYKILTKIMDHSSSCSREVFEISNDFSDIYIPALEPPFGLKNCPGIKVL